MKKTAKILTLICIIAMTTSCNNSSSDKSNKTEENKTSIKRYVRKNIHSKTAEKDLEALDKALKIMRSKDCSDPLSWYYQGAMHWIPDTILKNPLCESYHYASDKKDAWDNCTHTPSGKERIHFLVWHRLYIYHFEKIVRKLSGYADFALPYWAYTDTTDITTNRTMPEIFRNKTSSLYEQCRFDSLNNGFPIDGAGARDLSLTKLNKYSLYYLFNKNIDVAPHGAMHGYIGSGNDETEQLKFQNPITQSVTNTGLMGAVKTAAFDPIFWTHHSNIDRLWQKWTNSNQGQLVKLEELKEVPWPYVFFDENGKKIEYKIEDVVKMLYTMDYDFDDTKVNAKEQKNIKSFNLEALVPSDTLIAKKLNIKVRNGLTTLSILNDIKKTKGVSLLDNSNPNGKVLIMTINVAFVKAPRGNYEVYLNLPKGENGNPESKYFSGFMTFFGADHKHIMDGHNHMDMGDGKTRTTFTFEITPEALSSKALEKKQFDISILKFNGLPNEEIVVESVTITKM